MNQMIANAVARGWISFPTEQPALPKVEPPKFNAKRAWKLWNEGRSLDYVARAIGVKKRAVMAIIMEGKP